MRPQTLSQRLLYIKIKNAFKSNFKDVQLKKKKKVEDKIKRSITPQ